jgi:hypothetical protein
MEGGLGGADGCDGGQRNTGCSAKGSHSTHEVSPVGKIVPVTGQVKSAGAAPALEQADMR